MKTAENIKSFWFGHELFDNMNNLEAIKNRMPLWFSGASVEFDNTQREHAPLLFDSSITSTWIGPEGSLAKILLFDQFPRVIFRGTKEAFSFDEQALLEAAIIAQDKELLKNYSPIEQFFIGICLQHSEQLHYQEMGVSIAHHIKDTAPTIGEFFFSLKGYPNEHRDVILRFGRFPSRNSALGRVSTTEEEEWMASPECPAWARSQTLTPITETVPEALKSEEDQKETKKEVNKLYGSVKSYERHALICTNNATSTWPSHVESGSDFVGLLNQHIVSEVKLTLCEKPNSSTEYTDVIVFPDAKVYHVTNDNIPAFGMFLSSQPSPESIVNCPIPHDPLPFEKLVLVCTHGSRDKRCGRAGPQIITEMKRRLHELNVLESQVTVLGSSHIGGHVYAGTLIVYPSSDWYGYVTAKGVSIPSILLAMEKNTVYEKCHRGCANLPTW